MKGKMRVRGHGKEAAFSVTIDEKLRIRSWSDEFASVWRHRVGKSEPRFLHELVPIEESALVLIKKVFHNGKPMTLRDITLPCPYGSCDMTMNIHPLDRPSSFRGAKVFLEPVVTCHKEGRISEESQMEEVRRAATTLAHGVRNPLNAIKGAVVYIREKYAGDKHLIKFIGIIEEEITRLDTFIAHYLSSSVNQRNDAWVDVTAILKKIEILTSFQVQSRGITAEFDYGPVNKVRMNPFLFEQAILNVINNAVEAMRRGGQLKVTASNVTRLGKDYALVEISYTGSGIARSKPAARVPHGKGRGFGLLITYEVLRSVHGHLEIRSRGGKGTTVRLYFPSIE